MNNILKYLIGLIVLFLSSCEKTSVQSPDDENVIIPAGNYIMFSSKVDTKAELVTDMVGRDFYVLGYEYSNDTEWSIARATAKPDLFYKKSIEYNNGIWQYVNPVQWDFHSKYAFFAYYPDEGNGITISPQSYVNMPTVTYELPLTGTVDPSTLKDLMTASAINQTAKTSVVTFNFEHRLFCIDVQVINNDESEHKIQDLSLTLNDVAYNKIIAPMRKGDQVTLEEKSPWEEDVKFSILSNDEIVTIPADKSKVSLTQNETLKNKDSILLIPQDSRGDSFRGTLSFKLNGVQESASFDSPQNFIEGYKYVLTMSIIGGNVLVTMNNPVSWDVNPDINFDFE